MDDSQKRAALFEYFKQLNNPKWVSNGEKLFTSLSELKADKLDQMYSRMLELKARAEQLKKAKETPMYKRWKMPLAMLLLWSTFGVIDAMNPQAHVASCMLQAFIAGSYFEELMSNLIYNYIESKYSKDRA